MRPVRIEAEGFTAFRKRVVVSFEDADLFAFVGPTGAGKSSLIDAMVFALYGKVPYFTTAAASVAAVQAIAALKQRPLEVRSLQSYYSALD